ncbi:hypothetical protein JNO54_06300 [Janibacter sp. YIM B02568]|uniref:hypothetical protein n=1 Tax=Janibacter endophyticus TaxID=2806261 RepID=UPI00195127AE|nr:hypothetical protein [Janibacter endophyticus]MBM6545749.1 hypothetical protein [Janibacter endophyticus]
MPPDSRSSEAKEIGPNYPVLASAAFLVVSVLLYWVRFPTDRDFFVVCYVLTCVLALLLGNTFGAQIKQAPHTFEKVNQKWLWGACIVLGVISTVNISVYYTSLSEIQRFIFEPGAAYERVKLMAIRGEANAGILGGAFGPLISMLNFTKYVVFAWTALYWRSLSATLRSVSLATMVYYAVQATLIGAMVNVGTVLLATLTVLLVKGRSGNRRRGTRWAGAVVALFGLVTLSYFLGSRDGTATGFRDRVVGGADGLMFYLTHGYVGLSHALDQPFVWTGGQTTFYGFTRLFSGGLPPESYPARTEMATGWSASQVWQTAAPWLASDITFWGVPLLLLFIGGLATRLWRESRATLNPFAVLLLGQLAVGLFFFPANNHLLQTFPNASGVLIITLLYVMARRRTHRGQVRSDKLGTSKARSSLVRS